MKSIFAKMSIAIMAMLFVTTSFADSLKDSRDGKTYKTVKIGEKVWMAENLNYRTGESKCYDDKSENCEKYGRLYTWDDVQNACPSGWLLPSKEEFLDLVKVAGGRQDADYGWKWHNAGTVLKSRTGWDDYDGNSGNGTDALGFAALPAGDYYNRQGFYGEGKYGRFWSSTEYFITGAYNLSLLYVDGNIGVRKDGKYRSFSVRCIKD